jgi:hypothetical protein
MSSVAYDHNDNQEQGKGAHHTRTKLTTQDDGLFGLLPFRIDPVDIKLVAEPIVRAPLLEPEVASKQMGVIDRIDTGIDRQSF